MENRKRFQTQMLNSEDYEKTEKGAKALKTAGEILGIGALLIGVGKKYGPSLLKNLGKILRL